MSRRIHARPLDRWKTPLAEIIRDANEARWMTDAACLVGDPERFFPAKSQKGAEAKAVCRKCPALAACLEFALDHPELDGVWGATLPTERGRMRNRRRLSERRAKVKQVKQAGPGGASTPLPRALTPAKEGLR